MVFTHVIVCVSVFHCLQFWGQRRYQILLCCFLLLLFSVVCLLMCFVILNFELGRILSVGILRYPVLRVTFSRPVSFLPGIWWGWGRGYQPKITLGYSLGVRFCGPFWCVNSDPRVLGRIDLLLQILRRDFSFATLLWKRQIRLVSVCVF